MVVRWFVLCCITLLLVNVHLHSEFLITLEHLVQVGAAKEASTSRASSSTLHSEDIMQTLLVHEPKAGSSRLPDQESSDESDRDVDSVSGAAGGTSASLSACLLACLSVCLRLSVSLSVRLSPSLCLPLWVSLSLPIYIYVCFSATPSLSVSESLSLCLPLSLSLHFLSLCILSVMALLHTHSLALRLYIFKFVSCINVIWMQAS